MQQDTPQTDTLYQGYDKGLYRITGEEETDNILDIMNANQTGNDNSQDVQTAAEDIGSGVSTATTIQASGAVQSGKADYEDTTAGYFLGIDASDGIAKFSIGDDTEFMEWNGSSLIISGGIAVSHLDIPDETTANSFHVDSNGNAWWGQNTAAGYSGAPASILATGAASFTNVNITGGSINTSTLTGLIGQTNLNVANQDWTQTSAFSSSSSTVVAWASGTFTTSGGTSYSISSGTTSTMSAKTYIFLDTSVSTTVYQTTTTAANAVGAGRVLIAVAQNNTGGSTFQVFGGAGGLNVPGTDIVAASITTNQIAANTIVGNNIAASTITASNLTITQLSAITANMGSITAGSIVINSGVASISAIGAAVFKSIQVGGSNVQYTLNDDGIFSYGDGSDGTVTCDGSTSVVGMSLSGSTYTLTRDVYFKNITINDSITLITNGYRIFISVALVVGNGASGNINYNAASAAGYLSAPAVPGSGAPSVINGTPTSGGNGAAVVNSITGIAGANGGQGGVSSGTPITGGAAGTGGTATVSNVKLIANWHLATLLDISSSGSTVKFTASAAAGGGGSGAQRGNSGAITGAGGNGGLNGGIVAIYAKSITLNAGSIISANATNGGNGSTGSQGGGGGGGGGNGGILVIVYNIIVNNGTMSVNAGTGGIAAAGTSGGGAGTNGNNGSAGVIYLFNLSL